MNGTHLLRRPAVTAKKAVNIPSQPGHPAVPTNFHSRPLLSGRLHAASGGYCSNLRVIRIRWDLKNNSDYAEKNALVLVSLTRKFVRITRNLLYFVYFLSSRNRTCMSGSTGTNFHFEGRQNHEIESFEYKMSKYELLGQGSRDEKILNIKVKKMNFLGEH